MSWVGLASQLARAAENVMLPAIVQEPDFLLACSTSDGFVVQIIRTLQQSINYQNWPPMSPDSTTFMWCMMVCQDAPSGLISEYVNLYIPTHTNHWGRLSVCLQITRLIATLSYPVICKHRKECGHTWYQMSILRPIVIKQYKQTTYQDAHQ